MVTKICSGDVIVNDTLFHAVSPFVPFGGIGESGTGSYKGKFSLEAFSFKRGIMRRDGSALMDISLRYPPYSKFALDFFLLMSKVPPYVPLQLPSFFTGVLVTAAIAAAVAYVNK